MHQPHGARARRRHPRDAVGAARPGDRRDPGLAQRLADRRAGDAFGHQLARIDRERCGMGAAQQVGLRVGSVSTAQPAALVAFAHRGQLVDTSGLAEAVATRDQVVQRGIAQFLDAVDVEVLTAGDDRKLAVLRRYLQSCAQGLERSDARVLVADMARQSVRRGQGLAQIVGQRGEADARITRREARGHVDDQLDVHPGIHLGMEFRALRHAVKRVHFR